MECHKSSLKLNKLVQWFLTFYARRITKIMNGLRGSLNHQTDLEKMLFIVNNFTFMTARDP